MSWTKVVRAASSALVVGVIVWIVVGPSAEDASLGEAPARAATPAPAGAPPSPGDVLGDDAATAARRQSESCAATRLPAEAPSPSHPGDGGPSLVGRVIDLDLRPAAGVTVTLAGCATYVPTIPFGHHRRLGDLFAPRVTTTDDDGRFSFDDLPPRAGYWLRATVPPSWRAGLTSVEVGPDGGDAGTLLLEPACRVRGRLEDRSGRPIAGVPIDVDLVVDVA